MVDDLINSILEEIGLESIAGDTDDENKETKRAVPETGRQQ